MNIVYYSNETICCKLEYILALINHDLFHTTIVYKQMYTGGGLSSKDHDIVYFLAAQIDSSYVTKKKLNSEFFRFRKNILIVTYIVANL